MDATEDEQLNALVLARREIGTLEQRTEAVLNELERRMRTPLATIKWLLDGPRRRNTMLAIYRVAGDAAILALMGVGASLAVRRAARRLRAHRVERRQRALGGALLSLAGAALVAWAAGGIGRIFE
jgi:hypothetical protein